MSARSEPDEPEEMEGLTRELWKFARGKGYERAVRRANASAAKFAAQPPQLRLPTGWVLAPAGAQVELGRLPYEAVSFGGRVVVLNNGYYPQGLEDPEISIVDIARPRVTRTLRVASLYPSAVVSPNGNLYVSGANTQTVAPVGDLVPGANLLYWNQDGRLFVHDFDRKKLVFSVDPVPGHTLWNPWPRTDGVWFVASKPTGGWAAYKEGELAFAGEGGVSGYYTDYLVVKNGDRTEVRDRTGQLVLRVPVHALQVRLTPDGQWAYTVTEGQVTAYRIP